VVDKPVGVVQKSSKGSGQLGMMKKAKNHLAQCPWKTRTIAATATSIPKQSVKILGKAE